ncbi:MAG: S8 family serine peptidase [Acidimicrobiia bacterium]|nr:S8 family serine peptidase [Acidimicrobiia bacterium]
MRTAHSVAVGIIAGGALLASTLSAGASPTTPATASARGVQTGAEEFVVSFEGADRAAALQAVTAAGGSVVDVNEAAGIALVEAADDSFLTEVRADDAVTGAAANHAVGTARPGMPHRFAEERPTAADRTAVANNQDAGGRRPGGGGGRNTEPLADRQWDMAAIGANPDGAWRRATGRGVTVGIIDTGVDASHPDIAPNFSASLSRNFTMDIPEIDGPCEVATCIDPANVDDGGHGTHVAGTVAAARNGVGIAGVAPDATIVNVRAGQDSGYFFVYETVAALTYAGDAGLDVVNMSFYTDPWLYNCDSRDDYVSGAVTDEELAQQAFIRQTVIAGLEYAHERGVTLVAAAGNGHTDLATPTRFDATSPDYGAPPAERTVTDDCLDLPSEGPHVLSVSAIGPSGAKADYSNYGLPDVEISAPGGWFRDGFGTDTYRIPSNLILSSYPLHVAIEEGLADANGQPTDDFSVSSCDSRGRNCGFYTYLQGTSMASPHVAGVAALVVEAHGQGNRSRGFSLDPDVVGQILLSTAADHACPVGGFEDYTQEGRPATWNAACQGSTALNGLYGEGVVDATAAVARR